MEHRKAKVTLSAIASIIFGVAISALLQHYLRVVSSDGGNGNLIALAFLNYGFGIFIYPLIIFTLLQFVLVKPPRRYLKILWGVILGVVALFVIINKFNSAL